MAEKKCKHGREIGWCCACLYGRSRRKGEALDPEKPKDLVDDLARKPYQKLVDGYDLIES